MLYAMTSVRRRLVSVLAVINLIAVGLNSPTSFAQQSVLTRSYDNARSGANIQEHSLTPTAISARGLRKVFSLRLSKDDPRVEAQPLYVPGLDFGQGKQRDVIYLFSMGNKVYAFDAKTGELIWEVSLGKPFVPDLQDPVDIHHINRSFGILATPVIDRETETIYAVNWIVDEHGNRQLKLNALQLRDGKPPPNKNTPLGITGSVTNAVGQEIRLDQVQKQRAALLLVPLGRIASPSTHKILYVATTGDDTPPWKPDATLGHHGWVVAFDVNEWKQVGAWVATPRSFGGGIWQSSQGPAADDQGNVYAMTSNGGYLINSQNQSIQDFIGTTDYGESFVKLSFKDGSLKLVDWFTPFRDSVRRQWTPQEVAPFPKGWNYQDEDLGSGGPLLPPGTDLLIGADKDGVVYVLDRNNLGKAVGDLSQLKAPPAFFTFDPDPKIPAYRNASAAGYLDFKPSPGVKTHHMHGSPIYWLSDVHGPMLFAWGENAELRAFALSSSGRIHLLAHGSELASADLVASPNSLGGMPGGMLTLSADGGKDGVVWATAPINGDANLEPVPGVVRAYDAAQFEPAQGSANAPLKMRLLWQQAGFTFSKFCPPVVADGRLLVPTYDGQVDVYEVNQ
jgi:outer membrane protein assembly factor BamB